MSEVKRGKFIVFEGLDGSGKGTQIRMLEKKLTDRGRSVTLTAEPTDTALGGMIRDALAGNHMRTPSELAALFLADRVQHNADPKKGIISLLSAGKDVICDRYYFSSFAYQGIDTDLDWVMEMNLDSPDILKPDICIFLDVDPDVCMQRIDSSRAFTEIYEKASTLKRIRSRFFEVFERLKDIENIKIIDAARSPEEIASDIERIIFSL
ncbi:MAG: dTMP kinase [Ruminiclostridium sp.]|nr:dTMP kinase [Clostridia bacterium]MBP3922312.1 dTMP kinase [Ruminiclostridium sp.]MBR3714438.1 dTMP kinase [Clostridia bacterium]